MAKGFVNLWATVLSLGLSTSAIYALGGNTPTPVSNRVPTSAVPLISETLGSRDVRYRVERIPNSGHEGRGEKWINRWELMAENPQQKLTTRFADGVTIRNGEREESLRLMGVGYGDELTAIVDALPKASGNRVEYRRGDLTEWYVNGPAGIEQGFTLKAAPGRRAGWLRIEIEVSGDSIAELDRDGTAISFSGPDTNLLRCAGLTARDAAGRELPARMELRDGRMILEVDDSAAKYPIVVDPTYSQATILTTAAGASMDLGARVATDYAGDVVAVTGAVNANTEVVFVFTNSGTGWVLANELQNPDNGAVSVAVNGNGTVIVVGSCGLANCVGHGFVYTMPETGWSGSSPLNPAAMLTASDGAVGDRIGLSVAINEVGDLVATGAPCDFTAGMVLCGSVYLFQNQGTQGWSPNEIAKLEFALQSGVVDTLGFSVDMDAAGATIVAGAVGVEAQTPVPGAVYVFEIPQSGIWVSTSNANGVLTASDGQGGDQLGDGVRISADGNTIVAGAPINPNTCTSGPCFNPGPGAAYVFTKPSGGWATATQNAKLTASDGENQDGFGSSLAISGDGKTIVSGAPAHPFANKKSGAGAAYVFAEPSGGWVSTTAQPLHEAQEFTAAAGTDINGNNVTAPFYNFAYGVAVNQFAGTIVAGSPSSMVGSSNSQGAAYLFTAPVCMLTLTSLNFGTVPEFTTVTMEATLANNCNTPFTFTGETFDNSDYTDLRTGTCGLTVAPNSTCTITVAFTPTVMGTDNGNLSYSSEVQASLTGSGGSSTADFTITSESASPASSGSTCPPSGTSVCSATVRAGQTATYTVTLTGVHGFSALVSMDAIFNGNGPNGVTFSFSQKSLVPSTSGVTVTMTAATTAAKTAKQVVSFAAAVSGTTPVLMTVMALLMWKFGPRRVLMAGAPAMLVIALAAVMFMTGCGCGSGGGGGGGGAGGGGGGNSTTPGTYTLLIQGYGPNNGPGHSAQVTLVVQ